MKMMINFYGFIIEYVVRNTLCSLFDSVVSLQNNLFLFIEKQKHIVVGTNWIVDMLK